MQRTHILSTGSFLPEKIISNEDLTQFSPEARKLIAEKTGVQTRRHASEIGMHFRSGRRRRPEMPAKD